MGSPGSQNLWAPNSSSSPGDCSQAVCSFDCQQFCILFSPPPPPDDSTAGLSPLIIAVIGVLVSGSLLVGYYTLVTRFCRGTPPPENRSTAEEPLPDQWAVSVAGLDESFIKRITVCKYQKGDGLIEGTDCAVCLSEFEENESLRLMPNCSHAFHIPCIDTWLTSQSSCPLCRANVAIWIHPAPSTLLPGPQPPPTVDVSRRDFHSSDDLILVVDQDAPSQQGLVATRGEESGNDDDHNRDGMLLSSTVSSQPGGRLLVSEILSLEEISERAEGESQRFPEGLTDHQRRFRGKIGSQGGAGTRSSHCS